MKKIKEHTNGIFIYMCMELDGKTEEIEVYLREENGKPYTTYRTSADYYPERRAQIIAAFDELY